MLSSIEKIYATLIDREYQQELFKELPLFQRKGTGFIARCPYHEDSMPTLLIYGNRPEYFCFACSARGDWIGFLMRTHKISFHEAAAMLAQASGTMLRDCSEELWEQELFMTRVIESAMESYIAQLWSKPGEDVLHYLYKRGYAMGEVEAMSLGYYPGYEQTMETLVGQGFNRVSLETAFDRFWNTGIDSPGLVIPYRDMAGRLMGLVYKDMRTAGPESYCFLTDSSRLKDIPFLMYRSRGRKDIIVVEGFFDALLVDHVRLKPVIGIGAEKHAEDKIAAASSFGADHFILALGNGERQRDATRHAIEKIRCMGLSASVLPMPDKYKDLDEYIRMTCLDQFRAALKKLVRYDKWLEKEK
ncbi:MAG TPA: CHC2 zinc finger domain-containing protein [Desulfomonilia bacterium]|nr:CHC2 zinc finger domain-containing protein [Desulfomonilia bacterium]